MPKARTIKLPSTSVLEKSPTGISGLDEITGGGLPKGRPTLVCGGPGCGKTVLAMEFLLRGAIRYNEPGVFMAFEESAEELAKNFASLGYNLDALERQRKVSLDHVLIERSNIIETGEYDLEGLFIRLGHAIDSIGAKRVVLDTVEALFSGFTNEAVLRAELRRLFGFLKQKRVTAIITGERGENRLTRYSLEEYVADCVISLDHRMTDQVSTRRLRIVKYRGSAHGTNEYPFLMDEKGLSVIPITSIGLDHPASKERISSGIPRLDAMLDGKGFYRGSSILVSGTAGTGKSSVAASFVQAACQRGERAVYFAFEESTNQIVRNMHSIGIHLDPWIKKGLLRFHVSRPTAFGLETHLSLIHRLIEEFKPSVAVIDPVSHFTEVGALREIRAMSTRLVDFLKSRLVTTIFTNLTHGAEALEQTDTAVSSVMDTWLLLKTIQSEGERNRGIFILKSRGMAHSNQVREFLIGSRGIDIQDIYVGPSGMLTGAARASLEAREKAQETELEQEIARRKREIERKQQIMEARIIALRAEFESEKEELTYSAGQERLRRKALLNGRKTIARMRKAD